MLIELKPETPFLVKSGSNFSLMDLVERNGMLYRLDTDFLSQNIGKAENEKLGAIMEKFHSLKVAAHRQGNRQRGSGGGGISKEYESLWKEIQSFYNSDMIRKYIRTIDPGMLVKSRKFTSNYVFSDYSHFNFNRNGVAEAVPYIPGSTIKGSVRRGIIFNYLSLRPRSYGYHFLFEDEEYKYLRSLMACIHVSDFYPVGEYTVEMSELQGYRRNPENGIPLVRAGSFVGEIGIVKGILSSTKKAAMLQSSMKRMHLVAESTSVGSVEDLERKIIARIIDLTSSYVSGVVQKYQGYYPRIDQTKKYMDIGFGKGLAMTGFVEYKSELKLDDVIKNQPAISHYLTPDKKYKLGLMQVKPVLQNERFVETIIRQFSTSGVR